MINLLKTFWKSRRLVFIWTRYNIQADYLDTKLGLVWLVLQPLLMTVIYSVVFSWVLNRAPRGGVPFINFFLAGMIMWLSFNNTMMRSTTLIAQNVNLMGQVKFPQETLIFVFFNEKMVDFIISFFILFFINLVNGYYPNKSYLYIPLILFIFFTMELGLMFFLATLGLFIRDVPQIVSLLLRLLFYFSGIIFPSDVLPEKAIQILSFNPIFFLVESFRNIIFYAEVPSRLRMALWFIFSMVILVGSFQLFQKKSKVFADYK